MPITSSSADLSHSQATLAGASQIQLFLRLEGLAAAVISAVLYAHTGANWWLFAALWLVPDLSILGYLAGPNWGARIYNGIHSYVTPATLAACALLLRCPALLPFALIWINHIGVDRMLGYGLKYRTGFKWTHLSKPCSQSVEAIPVKQAISGFQP